MLHLWSSRRTAFVETGSLRWIFSSAVTCAAVILWFFETILLNERLSFPVNADFHSLFLFADAVFPWFVYADITLKTVALGTPNNVAVFVTDAPGRSAATICPFSKSHKSPIFRFSHTVFHTTRSPVHWQEHYRMKTNWIRTFSVFFCSSFNVVNTVRLYYSFFMFPLFCPPLYIRRSWDGVVSIANGYGLHDRRFGVRVPVR
jgi:hypothetical protein